MQGISGLLRVADTSGCTENDNAGVFNAEFQSGIRREQATHFINTKADAIIDFNVSAGTAHTRCMKIDSVFGLVIDKDITVKERLSIMDSGKRTDRCTL
jgi:hypothetical protein